MHNLHSILENHAHKLLCDFDIQIDHLISARRPDLIIINKKERICRFVDFALPVDHRVKLKEWERRDKCLDFPRELKKNVEHESDDYTNCNWYSWYIHKRIGTRTSGLGNNGTGGHYPNYSIVEICWNTEKSSGDTRRLTVPQTPVENYQLTLIFKSWTSLIAFHIALIPLGKVWIQLFSLQLWVNSRTDWVL